MLARRHNRIIAQIYLHIGLVDIKLHVGTWINIILVSTEAHDLRIPGRSTQPVVESHFLVFWLINEGCKTYTKQLGIWFSGITLP